MLRCFFHSLAFWVAEQLTKCPQETIGHMVWGKVPYKAIRPFGVWHRGASVWDDNYLPGKCSISRIRRTLIPRVNAGAKEKSALFQPVTAGFGIYPRAYKINIRAHELTNRIRKQKKRRTNGECPYFPEELARRQTPKKEWEGCTLIPQMQSLLQTDMSANCLFQDYSVCFSQSREKEITITLFLICFLLLKINYCTVLHHHPSKNDWLFTTHWHK